ncbi:MAG: alpha/beta fold hydrolase [Acidobacteria bacterium]|nr:alpha/beta fold hydrolase [Acidobacteriota bacterium]
MSLDSPTFGLLDEGAGEPVIWLHSSAASKRQWRRILDGLPPGYRFLAIDLWGYGETPLPAGGEGFSLEDEADLVERLFERFEGPCRLVGHSYGGAVALKAAQRQPERIRSVFVYEPVLFHLLRDRADAVAERAEIEAVAHRTRDLSAAGDFEGAAETFVRYWSGDAMWDALSAERRAQLAAFAPKAALDFQALDAETAPASAYGPKGVSLRIVAGALSPAPARKVSEILGEAFPGRLQMLEGLGHMAPLTHPEPVRAAIEEHWAEA